MYGLKKLGAVVISIIIQSLTFLLAILIGLSALGLMLINIWTLVLPIIICAYLWKIRQRLKTLTNVSDTFANTQPKQESENIQHDVTVQAETSDQDQET